MSPLIFSCILCGHVIWDDECPDSVSWLEEFRALCSNQTKTWVSGVGLYKDIRAGIWVVPSDYGAHWNDVGYYSPADDEIPVMQQSPVDGKHGFVFHEACWSLLLEVYDTEPVPLTRLVEICNSLPFPLRGFGVSWGHDYGNLVYLDHQNHYPWEDKLIEREDGLITYQYAKENPYDVPQIQQLLQEYPQNLPTKVEKNPSISILAKRDRFIRLPWEILEKIAVQLPTADALNLRRASKIFMGIFSSQSFWASRFESNAECNWLFETRKNKQSRNWRLLYHLTNNTHGPPGLQNRKRIWKLIQLIKELADTRWSHISSSSLWPLNTTNFKWTEITGDLRPKKPNGTFHEFNEGCRLFKKEYVAIPSHLSQIAFSTSQIGIINHITAIRLISSDGTDICLGYRMKKKEILLNIVTLKGVIAAVGSRGVQALQIVTGEGSTSQWIGSANESPKTRRLANIGSVIALEAGFDGYKLVSLALAEKLPCHNKRSRIGNQPLRETALWYPDIPEPTLYLNDEYFVDENTSAVKYRPLCWSLFGGYGGTYLKSLTGVSVIRLGFLCGIDFHYNTNEVPAAWRKLGRRKFTEYAQVTHFSIDGPGGELIETVEADFKYTHGEHGYNFHKQGKLRTLKISTNRGRSFHFRPANNSPNELTLKTIGTAPGTTLTGLYASQHPEIGLTSLGVISEAIKEQQKQF